MKRQLSVLVVDDEPSGLEALARLLTLNGHQVHRAGTVADALELAARVRFDLLISDLGLTDGTGMDLLGKLRELYHCPAIAITGHVGGEYAAAAERAGFAKRIVKPASFTEVMAGVEEVTSWSIGGEPRRRRPEA